MKTRKIVLIISIQFSIFLLMIHFFKLDPVDCREMHAEVSGCIKIVGKKFNNKKHMLYGRNTKSGLVEEMYLLEVDDLYDSASVGDWVIKAKNDTLFHCLHTLPGGKVCRYTFAPYCRRYYPCLKVDQSDAPRRQYDSLDRLLQQHRHNIE